MKRLTGKFIARRLIAAILLVFFAPLSACFDLGAFDGGNGDYEDYYKTFGTVTGFFDGGEHGYEVDKSLFNDYVIENMDWQDDDDEVLSEEYAYIVIPFEKAVNVECIALFLRGETDVSLSISAFYFESKLNAPKNIRYKTSPDTEIIVEKDEEGNDVKREVKIEYDDPPEDIGVAFAACDIVAGEWSSFMLSDFMQEGYIDGLLHTGEDGALYIRVNENSGLYMDKTAYSFSFIGLLVRAV